MPEATARTRSPVVLLLPFLLVYAVAFVGWLGAYPALRGGWYAALLKPAWAPPAWLFGPIWTLLFGLMGLALLRIASAPPSRARAGGIAAFAVQLALGAAWSWTFFTGRLAWAAIEIVFLLLALGATVWFFGRVRAIAAWLILPYVLWIGYATALTIAIWQRNPTGSGPPACCSF